MPISSIYSPVFNYSKTDIYHDLLVIQCKASEECSLIKDAYEEELSDDYPDDELLCHLGIRYLDYVDFLHQIELILEKIHHSYDED